VHRGIFPQAAIETTGAWRSHDVAGHSTTRT
jgi:hypothetical protein